MNQRFSAGQANEHAQHVGDKGAIGVAPVLEVNHDQQLGEEDDVDQIRTHGPETVFQLFLTTYKYFNKKLFLWKSSVTIFFLNNRIIRVCPYI
jgi:hypothetical protein